jgi:TonB family protein
MMPTMKRWIYPIVLATVLPQLLCAADKPNQQDAIKLLQQAVAKTNIFELPSFAMRANFRVDNHGKQLNGTYELLWNGPDEWREGISLPGYSEVQIGGKGQIWLQRSTDFMPFPVHNLLQALGFGSSMGSPSPQSTSLSQFALGPKDAVKKATERKEHGEKLTCYEIENEHKDASEVCVQEGTGTIARRSSSYADTDLQPVAAKFFPRHLSVHFQNQTLADVSITEISTPIQFPPETFTPPVGVSPRAGCMNPTLPRLVKTQTPKYPPLAREQRREGTAAFDTLIGTDGIPQVRRLVESAYPDLDDSARVAISQWRYEPGMCTNQPIEIETVFQVHYRLSY